MNKSLNGVWDVHEVYELSHEKGRGENKDKTQESKTKNT